MELFLLYIWLKLEAIKAFLILICFVLIAVSAWSAVHISGYYEHYYGKDFVKQMTDRRNKAFKYMLVFLALVGIIPSKADVAILVGANYAFKAADTPEAQKVMTLIRNKANEMLDEQLKEEKK
jgi:hypothetical protein